MIKEFDAVIIGSGPCGIGCAEVLAEAGISFAVVESYIPGGKVNIAPRVDNYPFEKEISGPDLAMKFADRLFKLKVPFINKEVKTNNKNGQNSEKSKPVTILNNVYETPVDNNLILLLNRLHTINV